MFDSVHKAVSQYMRYRLSAVTRKAVWALDRGQFGNKKFWCVPFQDVADEARTRVAGKDANVVENLSPDQANEVADDGNQT